jgi:hypothetical protein
MVGSWSGAGYGFVIFGNGSEDMGPDPCQTFTDPEH